LLAFQPAGTDGFSIIHASFGEFCKVAPDLANLSLKFHTDTAIQLTRLSYMINPALTPVQSIGIICQTHSQDESRSGKTSTYLRNHSSIHATASTIDNPAFRNLPHLALARPSSVLSVASAPNAASHASSEIDASLVSDLVQ